MDWDIEADVVVVGFGAAGACAALEAAAAGRSVVVLDRFAGGGATALSGGVVYAGGGTPQQRAAGVTDTAAAMFGYLRTEVGDVVPAATLRQFCDGSVAMLAGWRARACRSMAASARTRRRTRPTATTCTTRAARCRPAPSRPRRRGVTGPGAAARRAGCCSPGSPLPPGGRASRWRGRRQRSALITADGQVTGVECRSLRGAPWWARTAHRVLHRLARKPYLYVPKLGRIMHRPVGWLERRYGRPLLVGAARGVVIAAGGFGASKAMLRAHAPSARGGLPLATPGDDGSGVLLGTGAGGATALLDRVSVWRFLSPPPALLRGVLVDADGKRSATSPGTARRSATRSSAAADGRGCSRTRPRSPRPGGSCPARHCGSSGCKPGTC